MLIDLKNCDLASLFVLSSLNTSDEIDYKKT